jgi:hypothetical protein
MLQEIERDSIVLGAEKKINTKSLMIDNMATDFNGE